MSGVPNEVDVECTHESLLRFRTVDSTRTKKKKKCRVVGGIGVWPQLERTDSLRVWTLLTKKKHNNGSGPQWACLRRCRIFLNEITPHTPNLHPLPLSRILASWLVGLSWLWRHGRALVDIASEASASILALEQPQGGGGKKIFVRWNGAGPPSGSPRPEVHEGRRERKKIKESASLHPFGALHLKRQQKRKSNHFFHEVNY